MKCDEMCKTFSAFYSGCTVVVHLYKIFMLRNLSAVSWGDTFKSAVFVKISERLVVFTGYRVILWNSILHHFMKFDEVCVRYKLQK